MGLDQVGAFFKHLGEKVYAALVAVFGQPAIDQTEANIKTILQTDVLAIFQDGIAYASSLSGSDSDKRNAAFAKIKSDLAAFGKPLGDQVINLGIELVLGLVKGKAAAATA